MLRAPVRVSDVDLMTPLLLGLDWMDPEWWLDQFGQEMFWASVLIVFVECGLLFPILPGDSLLFAVGLFIAEGSIDINIVVAGAVRPSSCAPTAIVSLHGARTEGRSPHRYAFETRPRPTRPSETRRDPARPTETHRCGTGTIQAASGRRHTL